MLKETVAVGRKVGQQMDKESRNARSVFRGIANILPEIWHTLVNSIPKMIRLSVKLMKSKKISDKARFTIAGAVLVIGFAIADEFITTAAVFSMVAIMVGPIAALLSLVVIKKIKFLLLAAAFFVIVHTFNTMVESEEVKKLSDDLFGEKESESFLADIQSLHQKLKKYFDPIAGKLSRAFEKLGRKKKKIDPEYAGEVVIRASKKEMNNLLGWAGTSKTKLELKDSPQNGRHS